MLQYMLIFLLQIFKKISLTFSRSLFWGASCQIWSATTTWSPAATSPPTKSPSCWPTTFVPSSPRFKRWSRKRRFRGKNFKNIPVFKSWKINMFIRENFHLWFYTIVCQNLLCTNRKKPLPNHFIGAASSNKVKPQSIIYYLPCKFIFVTLNFCLQSSRNCIFTLYFPEAV